MKTARLNSSLLMRKGCASPIPNLTPYAAPPSQAVEQDTSELEASRQAPDQEAAGAPRPTAATVAARSRGQGTVRPVRDRNAPLVRDHFGRVRLSLRLDPHRHLRLKLLAAHSHRSIQETLIDALDIYLAEQSQSIRDGSCTCLTETDQTPPPDCDKPCHAKAKGAEGQVEPS
jgi:hypothetical protein